MSEPRQLPPENVADDEPQMAFEGGPLHGMQAGPVSRLTEYHDNPEHEDQFGPVGSLVFGPVPPNPNPTDEPHPEWVRYVIDPGRSGVAVYDGEADIPMNFRDPAPESVDPPPGEPAEPRRPRKRTAARAG